MDTQKNVLLAFTGGRNSIAAAYLLLKQGFKVTGCSFLMGDLESSCSLNDFERTKEICGILGIELIVVDLKSEYFEKVTSPALSARLLGEDFNPCFECNILRIEGLIKKAKDLSIDFVATGHVANLSKDAEGIKLFRGRENDQSFFISGLREKHLEKLLLPLGKLTEAEIEKITETIGHDFGKSNQQNAVCMRDPEKIISMIERDIPLSLRFEGLIIDDVTKVAYGNHTGIYNFYLGMKNLSSWSYNIPSDAAVIGFDLSKNQVVLKENVKFVQDLLEVSLFNSFWDVDLTIPITCYLTLTPVGEKISCVVFPGNNGIAVVKMEREIEGPLEKGKLVVFYESLDGTARLVATGFISKTGMFDEEKREQSYFVN
jgi:tRNA-specific 2-thiouridylase